MIDRRHLRNEVIARIESAIPGSVVVWAGCGACDDEEDWEDVEAFEAYVVQREDYGTFLDLVLELKRTVGRPNGVWIMVHALSPEATRKHRQKQLEAELRRRGSSVLRSSRSWEPAEQGQVLLVGVAYTLRSEWCSRTGGPAEGLLEREPRIDAEPKKFERPSKQWGGNGLSLRGDPAPDCSLAA